MSLRDRALASTTRRRETMKVGAWGDVIVLELDTAARMDFMASVDPEHVRADMSAILPYMHELILDPETDKPAFGIEDMDTIKSDHPGILMQLLMKVVDISELGAVDEVSAEGNSPADPTFGATSA